MRINKVAIASALTLGAVVLTTGVAFAGDPPAIVIQPPESIGAVDTDINSLIAFVINAIIVVAIVLALIFLLYGGVRWVMSGGDKAKVDAARGTIVAAIVGLIIVILAWVIINAVLQILTGKSLNDGFQIPTLRGANSTTP